MPKYTDMKLLSDEGGFGTVWLCKRDTDGQKFAKKRLRSKDPDLIERFVEEARMLQKLSHPNLIQIVGLHFLKAPYWYVMPLYGSTLKKKLPKIVGDDDRINRVFLAVLEGMAYAHSEGFIHRDLKPANVLMNSDDDVVVSDFGLGRDLKSTSTRRTKTGIRMGTLLYMSPEQQTDAKRADERSDIYSLGRMLFELHTGPLKSTATDTSSLPPGLAMVIDRCVEHDPSRRYQTVAELRHAWMTVAGLLPSLPAGEESDELIALLRARAKPEDVVVRRILDLLVQNAADTDFVHDVVMKMPATSAKTCLDVDKRNTRRIIRVFSEHCTSQGWGFSYTDSIGSQCKAIYEAVSDFDVRAELVACVVDVGVSHNRFFVMGVAKGMLEEKRDAAEALAFADRLKRLAPRYRTWILDNVSHAKLGTTIVNALQSGLTPP